MILLLYHCIIVFVYHCIIVVLYCCMIVLLYYYIIVFYYIVSHCIVGVAIRCKSLHIFFGAVTKVQPQDDYTIVFEGSNFVLPAKFCISLFYVSLGELSEFASQRNHTFGNLIFRSGKILFLPAKSKKANIQKW